MATIHSAVLPLIPPGQEGESVKVITTLGEYKGRTYYSVPDGLKIPKQRKAVGHKVHTYDEISEFADNLVLIKAIDNETRAGIRKKYSPDDEYKMLRLAVSSSGKNSMATEYNRYVTACVSEGKKKKLDLGLGQATRKGV